MSIARANQKRSRFLRARHDEARALAAVVSLLYVCASAQVQPGREDLIHVEVLGLRSDNGQVLCALFASADDFPGKTDKSVAQTRSDVSQRHAVCEFPGLNPG